jgi:hypothetical protein
MTFNGTDLGDLRGGEKAPASVEATPNFDDVILLAQNTSRAGRVSTDTAGGGALPDTSVGSDQILLASSSSTANPLSNQATFSPTGLQQYEQAAAIQALTGVQVLPYQTGYPYQPGNPYQQGIGNQGGAGGILPNLFNQGRYYQNPAGPLNGTSVNFIPTTNYFPLNSAKQVVNPDTLQPIAGDPRYVPIDPKSNIALDPNDSRLNQQISLANPQYLLLDTKVGTLIHPTTGQIFDDQANSSQVNPHRPNTNQNPNVPNPPRPNGNPNAGGGGFGGGLGGGGLSPLLRIGLIIGMSLLGGMGLMMPLLLMGMLGRGGLGGFGGGGYNGGYNGYNGGGILGPSNYFSPNNSNYSNNSNYYG